MSNTVTIIVLSGVACLSQVEESDVLRITRVTKSAVPCAVVVEPPPPVAPPAKAAPVKKKPAAKSLCKRGKAVWYTNKSGKRRYRCR